MGKEASDQLGRHAAAGVTKDFCMRVRMYILGHALYHPSNYKYTCVPPPSQNYPVAPLLTAALHSHNTTIGQRKGNRDLAITLLSNILKQTKTRLQ